MQKDTNPSSTISTFLETSIIGQAAKDAAAEHKFPMETSCLAALVIASHAVGSAYCVESPGGRSLPIPLFGMAEQPSNSAKTSIVEEYYSGYSARAVELNKKIAKEREAVKKSIDEKIRNGTDIPEFEEKELERLCKIPIGTSDPTPEGLESEIASTGGFFIAYSTEQGLSKTLLGGMYSEGRKKDDLILKAFNAEYHSVVRANRDRVTFSGKPYGGVFELSQSGTIARVMESAGSTGISERFLMLREGDLLGTRSYLHAAECDIQSILTGDKKPTKSLLKTVKQIPRTALMQYRAQMSHMVDARFSNPSPDFHGLKRLKFSDEAWIVILAAKQKMENEIGSDPVRNAYIASMKGKIDLQIMKIAGTLHCMDWDKNTHGEIGPTISEETARNAFWVAFELLNGVSKIADEGSLYGLDAENEAILDYLSSKQNQTMKQIKTNMNRRKDSPFRFYTQRGAAFKKIEECVEGLVKSGRVVSRSVNNGTPKYSALE